MVRTWTEVRMVRVIPRLCRGCGLCERECPVDAITVRDGVARIDGDRCVRCGLCVRVCPFDALLMGRAYAQEGEERVELLGGPPDVRVRVIEERCVGCQACSSSCPFDALFGNKGSPPELDEERCVGCLECVRVCPARAIKPVGEER